MRTFFLLLVLANVAFFAWTRFVGGGSGIDPRPLARQIEPERIRVVSPEELANLPAAKPSAPAAAAAPAAAVASAPVANPPSPALKCIAWGSFAPADAARAKASLEPLALGDRLAERKADESAAWWVYIPPPARAGNPRQAALRKGGELKKLGVQDYFIVQEEGAVRWAISLGVFHTEEAAQARLAALREQGVHSARVGPRETRVPKIWLEVRGVDPALEKSLQQRARNFPDTELRDCVP